MISHTTKSHPSLTPERIRELKALAKTIDREDQAELKQVGRQVMDRYHAMMAITQQLRAERESQGLSLADVAAKVGGGRQNLARLERGKGVNPTLNTLFRYAEALGKRIEIKLV